MNILKPIMQHSYSLNQDVSLSLTCAIWIQSRHSNHANRAFIHDLNFIKSSNIKSILQEIKFHQIISDSYMYKIQYHCHIIIFSFDKIQLRKYIHYFHTQK